jgi:succinate-acetate transporter protein
MSDTATKPQEVLVSLAASTADPGPLGLAAFALTTFCLSVFNAGILNGALEGVVLPLALFYGGLAQLVAGIQEFKKGNTFGATVFSSYGAFWISFAAFVHVIVPEMAAAKTPNINEAVGLFLLAWTLFTIYIMIGSFAINGALAALLVVLEITFILLTWGNFANSTSIIKIGGYLGIIVAMMAWYCSAAGLLNSVFGKVILPVWPVKK